jgi:hypothetical protein
MHSLAAGLPLAIGSITRGIGGTLTEDPQHGGHDAGGTFTATVTEQVS